MIEPITMALIASAAAPVIGGLLGSEAARSDRDAAKEAQRQALEILMQAGAPPDVAQALILKQYEALGMPVAELEPEVQQAASHMADVQTDPAMKSAQMQALRSLQQIGSSGLRPEDKAAMMELQDQATQEARSQQQGILQNMQQRGMSGSGAEVAAMLGSQQGSANQGLRNAMRVSSDASQRALQAIGQAGTLGGQMRSQDFGEQSDKARAQDEMDRFNINNMVRRNSANVDRLNNRNQLDWQNRQNVSNQNVGLHNAEQDRINRAKQWMYDADLRRRGAVSQGYQAEAGHRQADANATQNMWAGIGSGVGQGFGAYANYQQAKPLQDAQINYYNNLSKNNTALTPEQILGRDAEENYKFPKR